MGASSSVNLDTAFFDKYTTNAHFLGKGASGHIYGPIEWKDKQLAIKQVIFSDDEIKRDISAMQKIWTTLDHKHLVRIFSVDLSQLPKALSLYIVMEFAPGGSLRKTLKTLGSENKLPIDVVTDWTKQMASGMLYLHKRNIVHRDLKASNILLMEPYDSGNPRKRVTLKIADFDEIKKHDHTTTMSFVGTLAYMASEVLTKQRFSKASDVWSFGVLIWEMLSGDIPHRGKQPLELLLQSLKGELDGLYIAPSFPEYYQFILKQCWKSTYKNRFSFQQVLDVLRPPEICGLTSLHQEVFVSRKQHPVVEVYDLTKFHFKRRITVNELTLISNVVSCSINNCLYAADRSHKNLIPAILRINPINGNLIRVWNLDLRWSRFSVANDSNLIVNSYSEASVYEYTADGELIRTIYLCQDPDSRITSYIGATHAVKLDNGLFVVCQSYPNVVYLLSTKETSSRCISGRIHVVEILKQFSKVPGELNSTFGCPDYLSVDKESSILVTVSDLYNNRAVLLSSNLDNGRILVSGKYGMISNSTCFDKSSGKWLVTDGKSVMVCLVEDTRVDKKIYKLTSLSVNQDQPIFHAI